MDKKQQKLLRAARIKKSNAFFTLIRNAGLVSALAGALFVLFPSLIKYVETASLFDQRVAIFYYIMLAIITCYSFYVFTSCVLDYVDEYYGFKVIKFVIILTLLPGLVIFIVALVAVYKQ